MNGHHPQRTVTFHRGSSSTSKTSIKRLAFILLLLGVCDVSWPKIHLGIELRLVLYSACIGLVKNEQCFYSGHSKSQEISCKTSPVFLDTLYENFQGIKKARKYYFFNNISAGCLKVVFTKDMCNCTDELNSAQS